MLLLEGARSGATRRENGITIHEVLVAMLLVAIALTLSAGALRNYWFTQALDGAADESVSGLRRIQEATVSESHPIVFGVRLTAGSEDWDIVRFDPDEASGSQCTITESHDFGSSLGATVVVSSVTVPDTVESSICRADLSFGISDKFFFFYPRGNATAGSFVLSQPNLGKTRTVNVTGITGRVTHT